MPSETRPADPTLTVENTRWRTTRTAAVCNDDGCAWKYHGVTQGATVAQARKHALATGHDVYLRREQHRFTKPVTA